MDSFLYFCTLEEIKSNKEDNMAGLYEQIINQLFKAKLEKYDRKIYHIGMKEIGRDEAIQYLSRYLYALIQNTIDDVAEQENGVEKCIQFTNDVIKELGEKFAIENYEDDLVDASNSIQHDRVKHGLN